MLDSSPALPVPVLVLVLGTDFLEAALGRSFGRWYFAFMAKYTLLKLLISPWPGGFSLHAPGQKVKN